MMSTLGMQITNRERRGDSAALRTLEFRQAMKDFRTMFPALDAELIECVLRSNAGHVDSTIDQLLQLSKSNNMVTKTSRRRFKMRSDKLFGTDVLFGSVSDDSIPSQMLDIPMSSDNSVSIREPPPIYTPQTDDLPENFFNASYPVDVPTASRKKNRSPMETPGDAKFSNRMYKAWNPPMLGALPEDFLRILPQQYQSPISKERSRFQKSALRSAMSASNHGQRSYDLPLPAATAMYPASTLPSAAMQPKRSAGPVLDKGVSSNLNDDIYDLIPPPRPPRNIPSQRDPRAGKFRSRSDDFEEGSLFIKAAAEDQSRHHHRCNSSGNASQRHDHHNSRPRRSNRCHYSQDSNHLPSQSSTSAVATTVNGNHTGRNSDYLSRRMVKVSRLTEPTPLVSRSDERLHRSSNSFHHRCHRSLVFRRNRLRPRTQLEEEQYVEDYRLAILLQSEEFMRELKRNDEFLNALENDRPNKRVLPSDPPVDAPDEAVPLPDPDGKYPHGSRASRSLKKEEVCDFEKDDKAFKENLRHMGKSAKKKFNDIAKKFSVRRKSSYKSMKNIDPVFANCDDNFDAAPGPRSPTFDL